MASLCLSAAPILRCPSFTAQQNQFLIIPPALEIIFSSALIFTNWRSGKSFLLITAEGWIYFALALLDLLTHILPAVRDSLATFRLVDILIAALSFLPLLLYTLFLYIFTTTELIDIVPRRFHLASKLILGVFIPTLIAFNEVSSFIGINYRNVLVGQRSVIAIGFDNGHEQFLWTFFSSFTLGLITAYQALNFVFAFFRISKAFLMERRMEGTTSDDVYLFNGIGWIAAGLKLGAIETVVGFVHGGFSAVLARRILRLASRALLCIGLAKGVDSVEDFNAIRQEMSEHKEMSRRQRSGNSNIRNLISNPRFSTFQQLSPSATQFHQNTRAADALPRAEGGLQGMHQFSAVHPFAQHRVTVHSQAGAPTLHMRFSALDLPSPSVIVEKVKSRADSEFQGIKDPKQLRRTSSFYPASTYTAEVGHEVTARTPIYARHTRAFSQYSYAESMGSFQDLTAQFPGIPPRVTTRPTEIPPMPSTVDLSRSQTTRSDVSRSTSMTRSSSFKRKPVPPLLKDIDPFEEDTFDTTVTSAPAVPTRNASTSTTTTTMRTSISDRSTPAATVTSGITTPDDEDHFRYDKAGNLSSKEKNTSAIDQIRKTTPVNRIKSVGKAPQRATPLPTKAGMTRGSVHIVPIMIPPRELGMPDVEIIQEDDASSFR